MDFLPEEMKAYIHTKTHTGTTVAALHLIAKRWRKPSVHQQMNGKTECGMLAQRDIIQYKKKEVLIYTTTWMNLENIMLR